MPEGENAGLVETDEQLVPINKGESGVPAASAQDSTVKVEQPADKKIDYEAQYKELQADYTRKSQKLADMERTQLAQGQQKEVVAEKQDAPTDPIAKIDARIQKVDAQLKIYAANDYDLTALEASRDALELQKESLIEKRQSKKYNDEIATFANSHKDFRDYDGLGSIIIEKSGRGEVISLDTAHEVWEVRQGQKHIETQVKNTLESQKLAEKARQESGGTDIQAQAEDKDLKDYYQRISRVR